MEYKISHQGHNYIIYIIICHMLNCHRFWSESLEYSAQQNLQSKTEFAEINRNTLEI